MKKPDVRLELAACRPQPVDRTLFNPAVKLPYGCTVDGIRNAMTEFLSLLYLVNSTLHKNSYPRLETMLMPANFSSVVSEFMGAGISKYCPTLARNRYHNGHPDLIPAGRFPGNSIQYAKEGIEVKASRYVKGWQGHNPEDAWLLVFVFSGNGPADQVKGIRPKSFRFLLVAGAQLKKSDWLFSGRSGTSRRTITASVKASGYQKMMRNWVYKATDLP